MEFGTKIVQYIQTREPLRQWMTEARGIRNRKVVLGGKRGKKAKKRIDKLSYKIAYSGRKLAVLIHCCNGPLPTWIHDMQTPRMQKPRIHETLSFERLVLFRYFALLQCQSQI